MSLNSTREFLDLLPAQKCLTNTEVVTNICKFLNYKQQYQISQASSALTIIIIDYIWDTKFTEIEIQVHGENDFIVINKIYDNVLNSMWNKYNLLAASVFHLNNEDLEKFFNLNKNNIIRLKIDEINAGNLARLPLNNEYNNLIYIDFSNSYITFEVLRNIAVYCKNIETLVIFNCINPTVLNNVETLEIIGELQNLKCLKLTIMSDYEYHFSNLVKIVNDLKLQQLTLLSCISYGNDLEQYQINSHKLKDYKDFVVGTKLDQNLSLYIQNNFLTNFENVCHLYITDNLLNNHFFNILLTSCGNLIELKLMDCKIEYFAALPKLKRLHLFCCYGLRYRDLITTMNEMNLKSFVVFSTTFKGDSETFPTSATLENLLIEQYTGILNITTKLMKLKSLHLNLFRILEIKLEFAPNLQNLGIDLSSINIEDIFKLRYLQKVVLNRYFSYEKLKLKQLMAHENLTELSILQYNNEMAMFGNRKNLRETEYVTTNLLHFNIPLTMMENEENFVLDLLNVNTKLSLKCCSSRIIERTAYASFVRRILNKETFPQRFASINICGYLIDCAAIRGDSVDFDELLKFCHADYYFILQ